MSGWWRTLLLAIMVVSLMIIFLFFFFFFIINLCSWIVSSFSHLHPCLFKRGCEFLQLGTLSVSLSLWFRCPFFFFFWVKDAHFFLKFYFNKHLHNMQWIWLWNEKLVLAKWPKLGWPGPCGRWTKFRSPNLLFIFFCPTLFSINKNLLVVYLIN